MAHYYVSKLPKANGDYDVHTSICIMLPPSQRRGWLLGTMRPIAMLLNMQR